MGSLMGRFRLQATCKVDLVSAIFGAYCSTHLYFLLVIEISSGPMRFALNAFAGELLG